MRGATPMNASRLGVEVACIPHCTKEEWSQLGDKDTLGHVETGEEVTVIGWPNSLGVFRVTPIHPDSIGAYASEPSLWYPTGATLARLRPEPREIREGQVWKSGTPGALRTIGRYANPTDGWELGDERGRLIGFFPEHQIRAMLEFVSEPAARALPAIDSKWRHRATGFVFDVSGISQDGLIGITSPDYPETVWYTLGCLRMHYEEVREGYAPVGPTQAEFVASMAADNAKEMSSPTEVRFGQKRRWVQHGRIQGTYRVSGEFSEEITLVTWLSGWLKGGIFGYSTKVIAKHPEVD